MPQGKRGMMLENMVEKANKAYKLKGWGLVDKVPTPWKVFYNRKTGRVNRAFPEKKGTVDFVGISQGRSIAFDAKNTQERTRFPLENVEGHQVDYLLKHQEQGGISFLIVCFEKINEFYYVPIDQFIEWWDALKAGGRKSIPHKWFVLNCNMIRSKNGVVLDYLRHCGTIKA